MTTPSPLCDGKDGSGAWTALETAGLDVTPSNTVTIRLRNTAGADVWTLAIISTDDTAPSVTVTVNQTTKQATFTAPAAGKALRFQSTVQTNGSSDTYSTTFCIYTQTNTGYRVVALDETTEGGPYGWSSALNTVIRTGWPAVTAGDSDATGSAYRAASINSTSTTLTLTGTNGTGTFSSSDVGKTVIVTGAGASGADLYTTVASYSSPTSVTLSDAASTTVTSQLAIWYTAGKDDTTRLQAAIDACTTDAPFVELNAGVFVISSSLSVRGECKGIVGAGKTATWIVASSTSLSGDMLSLSGLPRGAKFTGFGLKGPGMATTASSALVTAWSITSNVVTITASNSFSAGQSVVLTGFQSGPTYLNNLSFTILTASGSDFTFAYTHANASGSDTAIAYLDRNGIATPQGVLANPTFEDLLIVNTAGAGIRTQGVITGLFRQVLVEKSGGHGFALFVDSGAAAGTSCHFDTCYANACYAAGYYARTLNYSTFTACAADSCGVSYYLHGGASLAMNACGSEVTVYRNAAFAGIQYMMWGPNSAVLNGCYATTNSTAANAASTFLVFGNTARDCFVSNFKGNGNGGTLPTYLFDIKSGCRSITIWEPNFVNFATSAWANAGSDCVVFYDGSYQTPLKTAKALIGGLVSVAYSATPTFDLSLGNVFAMTLTGAVTLATFASIDVAAGQEVTFILTQDATGGRTFAWPAGGGPAPVIDLHANAVSVVKALSDGNQLVYLGHQVCTPPKVQTSSSDTLTAPNNTYSSFATTYTLPANAITTGSVHKVTLGFVITTDGAPPTLGVRVQFGGVTVFNGTSGTPTTNMSARPCSITLLVVGSATPGAAVSVFVHPDVQPGTGTANHPFVPISASQPVTLATNGSLLIQPAFFASATSASNSMTLNSFVVEQLA